MISPSDGPDQWDTLIVAGKRSPGVMRLSGPGLEIGWDVKNAQGQGGATSDLTSDPLKKFDAEFELSDSLDEYNISDFDSWDEFQDLLLSSVEGTDPVALEVFHPDLARVGITAMALVSIGLLQADGKGGGKIKVSFIEHRPPKPKKTGSAKQVKTEGDKKIDEAKAELQALLDEGKKPPTVIGDAL